MIVGSLLSNSNLEKRKSGSRFILKQSSNNVEYLMWFYSQFADRGYCSLNIPKFRIIIRKGRPHCYKMDTFTFTSFNYLQNIFYKLNPITNKYIKIIPRELYYLLTPMAQAIWFMDQGQKLKNGGFILATNCFTDNEIVYISIIKKKKYNLRCSINSLGKKKGHIIYIYKSSIENITKKVKPYMISS